MHEKSERAALALRDFLETPLDRRLDGSDKPAPVEAALARFRTVAARVPAYRSFLAEHNVSPKDIQTRADWERLPLVTKENYLQRYPLADRCRDGQLDSCDFIAVSSGSTGAPTFWPRFLSDELAIADRFEQVFHDSFGADTRQTLAVVCFPLGTWVGGMYTTSCCRWLAAKGYPITIVSPGNHRDEILRVVRDLAPGFEQTVLLGYPPFLKDVVDTGIARGVPWPDYRVKFVLAGEVFSEEWRDLVGERAGATDACYDFAALYGTADAGVLGNETPLSIAIRRFLAAHPDDARSLFGESRLPTLVQYDPRSRFFEVQNGTLLFSGDNGVPLVRYHISDTGGILAYEDLMDFLAGRGFDPRQSLRDRGDRRLPFVYVFGRSHFTVSFFGANIYPENVTVGLEQPEIRAWVTGKFVLQTGEDDDRNRFLSVVVELAPGEEASDARRQQAAGAIREHLRRLNSEFAHYVPPERQTPDVTLAPTGDPEYFPVGVKHRYTRR